MPISLFSHRMGPATVAKPKGDPKITAIAKLRTNLEQQKSLWNNGKGSSISKENRSRSLWFKKMTLSDDWMLKLKIQTNTIYPSSEARRMMNPYFLDIKESDMNTKLQEIIDGIDNKDAELMKIVDENWEHIEQLKRDRQKQRLDNKIAD